MGTSHCGHLQTDQPLPREVSRSVIVCFATQAEHVSGPWEQVLNAGKLRYSGLVSTHTTHSFVCAWARLRLPVTVGGIDFSVGGFADKFLAMTIREFAMNMGARTSKKRGCWQTVLLLKQASVKAVTEKRWQIFRDILDADE